VRYRDPDVDVEVRTTLDLDGGALVGASFLWTDKLRSPENERCQMASEILLASRHYPLVQNSRGIMHRVQSRRLRAPTTSYIAQSRTTVDTICKAECSREEERERKEQFGDRKFLIIERNRQQRRFPSASPITQSEEDERIAARMIRRHSDSRHYRDRSETR